MVNSDEPAFLPVGTEVSAKYKGAFCEAKIKKISKLVKCKVQYSNGTVSLISDEAVKGPLKVGASVEIKCDKKELGEATIQKIQDYSQYTVVFDDGDITCLKRTALCLKSGRHFAASSSLDQLPLTHPEHNGTLSSSNVPRGLRSRKEIKNLGEVKEEVIEMAEFNVGSVLCVETNDKKKVRDNWFPGLIVAPTAQASIKTNTAREYLVRSFKDGKYYTVQKKESLKLYTSEIGAKVENPTLKTAVEKTQLYITKDELPPHWDRDLLFGTDKCITTDSECAYDSENSDEESIEEKDHFIAQLFKFMDDRGTPLNEVPQYNGKELDLYKLFKIVNNFGGINKVSKFSQWNMVAFKMGEENMNEEEASSCFKSKYQLHLHSFEDFHRKLGCTMLSHPRGVRSRSRFSRNIIRDIDKALPNTSSTSEKNKQVSVKQESNEKKDKIEAPKENDTFKDPVTIKKTTKNLKSDDKSIKTNNESSKKNEKKKDDSNSMSRSKSVKWDPEILDSKDSKQKKELKEIIKKEPEAKEDNIESIVKKEPKKKITKNFFGKNVRKATKNKKVIKEKLADTELPVRKARSIKEQIKTFVKVITPFSKSKRGVPNPQQETLSKTKLDEDIPKVTRSKSKEELPNKSRKVSIPSDTVVNSATLQSSPSGSVVDNLSKVKKLEDGSEKKKPVRKKKDEKDDKVTSNDIITTPISIEVDTVLKDPPSEITTGDHIIVFYGDEELITYEAKILKISMVEGVLKYLVHYKGWNSRYDEWVESSRTALKCKGSDETDSLKNEPKSTDPKKVTPTNRTRRSATPSMSNSNRKKSPFSSIRPTRTCTLHDRLLSSIDNSDSESEEMSNLEFTKPNKKSQPLMNVIKSEPEDIVIKTEPIETDNQKKMFPKTYPSKEVLMLRNVPRKPKSCVFQVHSNKCEETEICEPVTLKPSIEYNFEMPPPSDIKNENLSNEDIEIKNECKIDKNDQNEHKIVHYLSPKEKSEKNDQQYQLASELKENIDEIVLNVESQTLSPKLKSTSVIYYPSSLEEEGEQIKRESECSQNNKSDESKISGTDFDLNKIRSEMKGLMPTTKNNISNLDHIHIKESMFDHQMAAEILKPIEPVTKDVYEFSESEPCDFEIIPSVIEEKQRRVIKHNVSPKLLNLEHPLDIAKVIHSITSNETELNESITPLVSDIPNNTNIFHNNKIKSDVTENSNIETENSISHHQSDDESNTSENLMTTIENTDTLPTNNISQSKIYQVELETDIKDEVLDLCMKPPESPPINIFSMPESNDTNYLGEDDDDDETKLVIAENDYQMDSNQTLGEENKYSHELLDDEQTSSSPLPLSSIHPLSCLNSEYQSSFEDQRNNTIPKDIDDESTTSCNESIQNALIQNFQMYTHFGNQSMKSKSYQSYIDNNDDSTKSGFEFDSNSKSPTADNTENIETAAKLSTYESTNNITQETDNYDSEKIEDKPEKLNTSILPELQCREEIVDEETLNNSLVIDYNRKSEEYDIHKPSTSKGFFDSINHPSSSKDSFYETDTECDTKNSFLDSRQANYVKSVIFDSNSPIVSRSSLYDEIANTSNIKDNFYDSVPSSSKSSRFFETSVPCSSKSTYNPDSDVNNVLFCEETIPGSPTGISEDHYDHEERKKISQELRDGREAREAASTMFSLKESYHRPMITLMGASEKELEEYTNMLQNDAGLLDQRHLQFLAEISSRNLSINVSENDPKDIEPSSEEVTKSPEKPPAKRKNSNQEHSSAKRNKTSSTTPTTTVVDSVEKPEDIKVPLKDGKPLISFTSDMDTTQRQALLLARMNDLRKEYILIKSRLSVVDRRRKKIRKRKRELAKAATMAQNKQNLIACAAK